MLFAAICNYHIWLRLGFRQEGGLDIYDPCDVEGSQDLSRCRHRPVGCGGLTTCWRCWRSLTPYHEASGQECFSIDTPRGLRWQWRTPFPLVPEVSSIPLPQTGSIVPRLLLKLTGPSQHWGDLPRLCGTWWEYVAAVQHAQSCQQEKGVRTLLCSLVSSVSSTTHGSTIVGASQGHQ